MEGVGGFCEDVACVITSKPQPVSGREAVINSSLQLGEWWLTGGPVSYITTEEQTRGSRLGLAKVVMGNPQLRVPCSHNHGKEWASE